MDNFPKFEILPEPIEKLLRAGQHAGEFLLRQLAHIQNAPDRHSDHYTHPLDEIYDQPQLPLNRWDSEGSYYEQ